MDVFELGDLVLYTGLPLLVPERWELIVKNNNGIVNLDEFAIIIVNDKGLKISTLFFQICQIEVPRYISQIFKARWVSLYLQ